MAIFEVSATIIVPTKRTSNGARFIDVKKIKELAGERKILTARGVYVFSIKTGRGTLPYYVGKTENQNFLREAFNPKNCNALNEVINS